MIKALFGSFLLLALTGLVGVQPARADGDPASDVLVTQDVFLPSAAVATDVAVSLQRQVERAYAQGERVKVAVILTPVDLGSIPSLFDKPSAYAKFLGIELQLGYVGPLLIAMPSGFGIYDGGRATRASAAILATVPVDRSSQAGLVKSAEAAVRKLSQAGLLRSRDILAPAVYPRVPFAQAGHPVVLSYYVLEDSERSGEVVTVLTGTTKLATFRVSMRQTGYMRPRSLSWQVPQRLPAAGLKYCVVATDPGGNRSKPTCASILIRAKV